MVRHKVHRNVLYSIVIILAVMQAVSFIVISTQISKLDYKIEQKITELERGSKKYADNLVSSYDVIYQQGFRDITSVLTKQKETFEQEIQLIKSTNEDFSAVVEQAIEGVVTVVTPSSTGSGFIISSDGYAVTNYHVIAGQGSVGVLTYDRSNIQVEIVAFDETRDIALLKLPEGNYHELKLGDSDELSVGNKVIAIGNPLGLSFTVTEGIVSGLNRLGPNGFEEYIQTDVSLNPGNSGGPLINSAGEVVGINNFKVGGAESLGFALEGDVVRDRVNETTEIAII